MIAANVTKSFTAPLILSVALYLGFAGIVVWTSGMLPDHVATHFDGSGAPDGWMSRASHVRFILIFGLAVPFLSPVLCALLGRTAHGIGINIPHREYWLAHERRRQTISYLVRQSLWLAAVMVLFFTGIQLSIVKANQQRPPHLPTSVILLVAGSFVVFTLIWVLRLVLHFRRVPDSGRGGGGIDLCTYSDPR